MPWGTEYWVAPAGRPGLAVMMRIEQLGVADMGRVRACHQVYTAAHRIDTPEGPWLSERAFGGWLTVGWAGDPREV